VRRERDTEIVAEAEQAKAGLRLGLEKSKALVAQYRQRLTVLRKAGMPEAGDNPIFHFKG
jgi:hypothetical protein